MCSIRSKFMIANNAAIHIKTQPMVLFLLNMLS